MRDASIHHDKTLQMNIDNSSCLFLTVIYNGTWHYLRMITKRPPRACASEPYPDYIISLKRRAHISCKKEECIFLLMVKRSCMIFASDIFPPSMVIHHDIIHVIILAYILYLSVRKKGTLIYGNGMVLCSRQRNARSA